MAPAACLKLAQAADACGYASVWFAENPMERGVLATVGACAAVTQRIEIAIGVWNPYVRHPSLIAMELAALDALSGGRAALGIGSGVAAAIRRLAIDNQKPIAALRDTFQIVRGLLRGETVTHKGNVFSVDGIKLGFAPLRGDVPLLMAARGERALDLCGQIADGLVVSNMSPLGFSAYAAGLLRESAAKAGRAAVPRRLVHYVPCIPSHDRAAAARAIKPLLAGMLKSFWALGQQVPAAKQGMIAHSGIPEADFGSVVDALAAGTPPDAALDQRFVDAFAISGTIDDCQARIYAYRHAGVTDLILTFVSADPLADLMFFSDAVLKPS
jgi:5,10-methylenetetrahydromethanopterin reductase